MATMNGDYFSYMHEVVHREFDRVGIKLTNFDVSMDYDPIHTLRGPVGEVIHSAKVGVEFLCSEEQFPYLQPFVQRVDRVDRPIMPDVVWGDRVNAMWDPLSRSTYEVETYYRCSMILHTHGGSMQSWIESFRESTDKLFVAMESKAFDEEVEKMLTNKDEYNN